jgi:hypothetical protein
MSTPKADSVVKKRHPKELLATKTSDERRYAFSPDTRTLEIRPIIDKQVGRWYLSFISHLRPELRRAEREPRRGLLTELQGRL